MTLTAPAPVALLNRKATMRDIPAMLALINGYARQGIMLPRTEFEMSEGIRDFTVLTAPGANTILAVAALHFYGPTIAEVRSLAVDPATKGQGAGRLIVEALEKEAQDFDLDALFAFTYVPGFFAKLGYRTVDRGELPLKAWKDCLRCPKFQACDEIAVLKTLKDTADPFARVVTAPADVLINIPTPRPAGI